MEDTTETKELPVKKEGNRIPELKLERAVLYHGSGTSSIKSFRVAEETTIGKGVYLTSDPESAKGYATLRAKRIEDGKPTVYKIEVTNLRLADLRHRQGVEIFSEILEKRLAALLQNPNLTWIHEGAIRKTLDKIRSNSYKSLKDLTWNHQDITTEIITAQGFDGLVALEGGEGEEVREHDSYLVFDPQKVNIQSEGLFK